MLSFVFRETSVQILPIATAKTSTIFAKYERWRERHKSDAGRCSRVCGGDANSIGTAPPGCGGIIPQRVIMMADTHSIERPALEQNAAAARPLSPHLQIYRPMLTMMMSIVHRITGFGNYFGTLLLAWWLNAAASPNAYARFQWFASSWIGRLILFGYTWSVIHHMLGGIRHLIWDTGRGFGPKEREWLAAANLIASVAITIVLWLLIMLTMGIA